MYIINGIAYSGDNDKPITVISARALEDYTLWLRFSTGETKTFDIAPLLSTSAFQLLSVENLFKSVYVEYGIPVWNNGEIDIAPEYLYQNGVSPLAPA